jgi:allophanate hydrolase subunit 2
MPVDTIRFAAVSVEEAHAIFREREQVLRDIKKAVRGAEAQALSIRIDGDAFEAVDDSGRLVSAPAVEGTVESEATRHARVTVDGRTFEFDVKVQRAD